jgi:hypothetical protein
LSFSVTINTFVEDERAFLDEWILNPHIFIMSTLMGMLKQSLYIVWEDIGIDRLNIQKRSISIGEVEIPINTSMMSFALPLQQSSQREITDFYSVQ